MTYIIGATGVLDDLAGAGPGVLVAAVFLLVGGPKRLPGLVTVVAVINRSCRQSHLLVNDPARDVHRVMDHMGLGSDVVIVLLHGVLWSPSHNVMNVAPTIHFMIVCGVCCDPSALLVIVPEVAANPGIMRVGHGKEGSSLIIVAIVATIPRIVREMC